MRVNETYKRDLYICTEIYSYAETSRKLAAQRLAAQCVCTYMCVWVKETYKSDLYICTKIYEYDGTSRKLAAKRLADLCVCRSMCVFGSVCVGTCVCVGNRDLQKRPIYMQRDL